MPVRRVDRVDVGDLGPPPSRVRDRPCPAPIKKKKKKHKQKKKKPNKKKKKKRKKKKKKPPKTEKKKKKKKKKKKHPFFLLKMPVPRTREGPLFKSLSLLLYWRSKKIPQHLVAVGTMLLRTQPAPLFPPFAAAA